jgi:phosphatidylcholine synthase
MFAPIVFIHPMRVRKWRGVNIAVCLVFLGLSAAAILQDLHVEEWIKAGFIAIAAYFLALPLLRHSPWADR